MPDSPPAPADDVPDNVDDLMFLSPEQYEELRKAREERQRDLTREEVETLLKALAERSRGAGPAI